MARAGGPGGVGVRRVSTATPPTGAGTTCRARRVGSRVMRVFQTTSKAGRCGGPLVVCIHAAFAVLATRGRVSKGL